MAQPCIPGHVMGGADRWPAKAGWWRDQGHVLTIQVVRASTGPVPFAEQDGTVEMGAFKIVTLCIGHEVQGDLRVSLLELRQAWNQPAGTEGGQA